MIAGTIEAENTRGRDVLPALSIEVASNRNVGAAHVEATTVQMHVAIDVDPGPGGYAAAADDEFETQCLNDLGEEIGSRLVRAEWVLQRRTE